MAKLLNKVLNLVGWEIDEEEDSPHASEEVEKKSIPFAERHSAIQQNSTKKTGRMLNLNANISMRMVVVSPSNFNETQHICDQLKERKPVILNLESLDKEVARKIFDFMLGAAYALDGSMMKISPNIFVFAPSNVDVSDFCNE
jgi:cell division inhibitor SepF